MKSGNRIKYSTKRQRRVVEAEDENTLDSLGLNINAIALGNEDRDSARDSKAGVEKPMGFTIEDVHVRGDSTTCNGH